MNPLLIYVDQQDPDAAFRKAVEERPRDWSEGFIDYYTGQGYGLSKGYHGLEGTLQVLRERKVLELEMIKLLKLETKVLDNTSYDASGCIRELEEFLCSLGSI